MQEGISSKPMSKEHLSALLAKLKNDVGLQEKLKGAADLDAFVAMAKDAGFDVSKADWLKHQAQLTLELSDEELESVTGGTGITIPLALVAGGMMGYGMYEQFK
jgi:predicted ribosomally synthesized peptide with nif11-like leader